MAIDPLSAWLDPIAAMRESSLSSKPKSLYAVPERVGVIQNVDNQTKKDPYRTGGYDLTSYFEKLARTISDTRSENLKISQMTPEISQASKIMISSIMSPNDLRPSGINISVNHSSLNSDHTKRINEYLNNFFNEVLDLKNKVPEWINEALYESGAKPILILPISELDRKFNDPKDMVGGLEAYTQELISEATKSIFGLSDSANIILPESYTSIGAALESVFQNELNADTSEDTKSKETKTTKDKSYDFSKSDEFKKACESLINDSLKIVDNPDSLKISFKVNRARKKEQEKKIQTHYKQGTIVSFDTPLEEDMLIDHPLMMELPTESIIPIYIPGSPSNHAGGYIILTDVHTGIPISLDKDRIDDPLMQQTDRRNVFDSLFRSYSGGSGIHSMTSLTAKTMAKTYQIIIEEHLRVKFKNNGFGDVNFNTMNNVYQYMLSRYFKGRSTQMVYVPKEFITYICDTYTSNGVGKSHLEDSKFILSLYINSLMANAMSEINNATNFRKITVDVSNAKDEGEDPLTHMDAIFREYVDKNTFNFTLLPEDAARSQAAKSISIIPRGLPGIENIDIENAEYPRSQQLSSQDYNQNLLKSLCLSLRIPPAVLNMLSENEYSRSIATTNLFFSRDILKLQERFCTHLTKFVKTFVCYSEIIQKKILEIIESNETKSNTPEKKEPGAFDLSQGKREAVTSQILATIQVSLPAPNIAPHQTQLDLVTPILANINQMIDTLYPDELFAGDPNGVAMAPVTRAMAKRKVLTSYLSKTGAFESLGIPEVSANLIDEIMQIQHMFANYGKGMADYKANILSAGADAAADTGGGGGFSGGGFN